MITGSAGFIGFHLAKNLLASSDVVVIGIDNLTDYYDPRMKEARNSILKEYANYHFYNQDIAEYTVLEDVVKKEKPEIIVHLAAQAGVRHSLKNPWAYEKTNYLGTLNIFEVAKRNDIKKVLYASSSSVYGKNTKVPFSESDRTDEPISVYGASKKANEVLAHSYNHLYGIETIGMRFFSVYGTYGRPDLALFMFTKSILLGRPIKVYNEGKMTRSFTYVDDIVAGIIGLIEHDHHSNEIYNLGGAEPVLLNTLIELIEKSLDKKAIIEYLPVPPGDAALSIADTTKAHNVVGFESKTRVEEGVKKFTDWFLENKDFLLTLKDFEV